MMKDSIFVSDSLRFVVVQRVILLESIMIPTCARFCFLECFPTASSDSCTVKHFVFHFALFRIWCNAILLFIPSCRFQGHLLYGIQSVVVFADRLRSVVSDCAKAAQSSDARDKYFLSHVGEFESFPSKGLRSELPALEAARASLEATVAELVDRMPQLDACRPAALPSLSANETLPVGQHLHVSANGAESERKGFAVGELTSLLAEARSCIMEVRGVLA